MFVAVSPVGALGLDCNLESCYHPVCVYNLRLANHSSTINIHLPPGWDPQLHIPRIQPALQNARLHGGLLQADGLAVEQVVVDLQIKVGEVAEGDLEEAQLALADAADAGEALLGVAQVLEGLHGDAQRRQQQPVDGARRHRHQLVLHAQLVDVRARRQVHRRAHRAVPLQPPQVLLQRHRRRRLAEELPRDRLLLLERGERVAADAVRVERRRGFVAGRLRAADGHVLECGCVHVVGRNRRGGTGGGALVLVKAREALFLGRYES